MPLVPPVIKTHCLPRSHAMVTLRLARLKIKADSRDQFLPDAMLLKV